MKKYLLSAIAILLTVSAMANNAVISSIKQTNATYKNVVCDFDQAKTIKLTKSVVNSAGKLYFEGDNLSMIYSTPEGDFLKITATNFSRQSGKSKINSKLKEGSAIMGLRDLLIYSMKGDVQGLADKNNLDVQYKASATTEDFTLVSKDKGVKMYNKMVLKYNKATKVLEYMELYQINGDFTSYTLKNIKENATIPAGTF